MPNITPVTPTTAAPADRLDLTESSSRSIGGAIPAFPGNLICFADDE